MLSRFFACIFSIGIATVALAAEPNITLVGWSSPEGIARLERSQYKADFFRLANHFESQENKLYCGLASSAIVLNALRLDNPGIRKPQDNAVLPASKRHYLPKGFDPIFRRYTQNILYKAGTKQEPEVLGKPLTFSGKAIADYGLQLHQLAQLLKAHGLQVITRVVSDDITVSTIRKELIDNMKTPGDYVLVNYARSALGQEGGGHISPLGAYDKTSDSFLIMDVNPNASEWVWVKTADLVAAMRSFDTVENRGYVLVKEEK